MRAYWFNFIDLGAPRRIRGGSVPYRLAVARCCAPAATPLPSGHLALFFVLALFLSGCGAGYPELTPGTADAYGHARFHLKPDNRSYLYDYQVDMVSVSSQWGLKTEATSHLRFSSLVKADTSAQGELQLSHELESIKLKANAPLLGSFSVDADYPDPSMPYALEIAKLQGALVSLNFGKKFELKAIQASQGEALKILSPDFKGILALGFNWLPSKVVRKGDSWQSSDDKNITGAMGSIHYTWTFRDIVEGKAILDFSADIEADKKLLQKHFAPTLSQVDKVEFEGKQQGHIEVELSTGMPLLSHVEQQISLVVHSNKLQMPVRMESTIHVVQQ
jgi:hypothetical protein